MATTTANRGKNSEKIVDDLFKKWNRKASFCYHRLPDSRSARGAIKAQPGDFLFFSGGYGGVVEVKETQHAYRLARDKVPQLPTLHKFEMAGAKCVVLVHHYLEGIWRLAFADDLPTDATSWDLSNFPQYTSAEDALRSTGWFE